MRRVFRVIFMVLAGIAVVSCATSEQKEKHSMELVLEELLSLERSALDRWITLDPDGYLTRSAPDVTYFDPTTDARINGLDALRRRLAPIKDLKLPFTSPRYEIVDPRIQERGDVTVLTFNLVNYGRFPDGHEHAYARWNSTQIYERLEGEWKILHSHWSYLRPELKQVGF